MTDYQDSLQAFGDSSPRKSKFNPDLANRLNKEAEERERREKLDEMLGRGKKKDTNKVESPPAENRIETLKDYWRIHNVEYNGETASYELAKTLLLEGERRSQEQWADYSLNARERGEFYTPDFPLLHGLIRAVYLQREESTRTKETQEIKEFFKDNMGKWLMTLTRVRNSSKGQTVDEVIHNYKQGQKYGERIVKEEIVGKDREIVKADSRALNTLIGNGDVNEIKDIYKWVNNTPTYIWRINSREDNLIESVARVDADSDRAGLDCYGGASYVGASIGVRRAKKNL